MILFKPERVNDILAGRKTVTRRRGRRRWKLGSIHQARTSLFSEPFARLYIVSVAPEHYVFQRDGLREIHTTESRQAEALREGFERPQDFFNAWRDMHGIKALDQPCWRVEFRVAAD